jgi:anionic cell wall polymer biosynthesis LytR-Cps2A-Psr (LCP) family protein
LLARTLTTNFDVSLDHYVVVNLQAFVDGIDAIGGIDLVFAEPLDLRSDSGSGYYYPAGRNHLDGKATLDYARARPDNSSDLFRIDRQTEIIRAVQERVLTPEVLPLVPRLAQSMRSSVLTDLSPADISTLVCLTRELDSSDIEVTALPEDSFTTVEDQLGYQVFLPDFELMTAYLAAFEAGQFPLNPN